MQILNRDYELRRSAFCKRSTVPESQLQIIQQKKEALLRDLIYLLMWEPTIIKNLQLLLSKWLTQVQCTNTCIHQYNDLCWIKSSFERRLSPIESPVQSRLVSGYRSLRERRSKSIPSLKLIQRPAPTLLYKSTLTLLSVGNACGGRNRELIKDKGITHIVNATLEEPNFFGEEGHLKYLRVAVHDNNMADIIPYFIQTINFIDDTLLSGEKVLVHCREGISRSPTLVIASLITHSSLSVMDSLELISYSRSTVGPNMHFLGQLGRFRSSADFRNCTPVKSIASCVEEMIAQRFREYQIKFIPCHAA